MWLPGIYISDVSLLAESYIGKGSNLYTPFQGLSSNTGIPPACTIDCGTDI